MLITIFYKNKPAFLAGFLILFLLLGFYLTERKLDILKNVKEKNFSGKVMAVREPEEKGMYQNIVVQSKEGARFLMRTEAFPEINYGEVLNVQCKLEIPKNFDDNFDYRMYLAKDGIFWTCQKPQIEKTGENGGNEIYAFILKVKNNLNGRIASLLPSPQSGLLSGLLIGGDSMLSKDYQDYFSRTGTTHIVAVSGYNVTIVAEYLMILGIFIGLWRKQAFWFAVLGIILFVVLVGMPASAVRAGVMGILLIWAMKKGRLANSQNAILLAAVAMLLMNPLLLRWDIGFQLSFLATLGIIYVYPLFEEYFVKKHRSFGLAEILMLTLSAQAFVLPVIFINFQKLSLISPLANVLVLPIIPITMLIGFISVIMSFIIPPLGQVFAWLAFLPLKYETIVIKFLASLKYSSVDVTDFSWLAAVGWYIILIVGISLMKRKKLLF